MEAHKDEFIINWKDLLERANCSGKFDGLEESFKIVTVDFRESIGYCTLIQTEESDDIVYGKRIGRDNYTRFVKGRKPKLANTVVFILNQNKKNKDEYYLITMFPGIETFREPEDINIKTREELAESLNFWNNHALVFDDGIIQDGTLRQYCPYLKLFLEVA